MDRLFRVFFIVYLALSLEVFMLYAEERVNIVVDASSTVKVIAPMPIGINLNYLMDGNFETSYKRKLSDALRLMGVKYLRYPGGEKADNYLWSIKPYTNSSPHFARNGEYDWPSTEKRFAEDDRFSCKSLVLDFDEFMKLCEEIDAKPIIVVCFDAMYKPVVGGKTPSKEELIETAATWVRYSKEKGYNIEYWEIGNESYHEGSYNGKPPSAKVYAEDLIDFARAMKKEAPSIKIGANGLETEWWQTVIDTAGEYVDFFSVHSYPAWNFKSYEDYQNKARVFTHDANSALSVLKGTDKFMALTEFNAINWLKEGGWTNVNDIYHSLVVFDIAMQNICVEKMKFVILWNTRWVNNSDYDYDIYDAINKHGEFNPTGEVLSVLSKTILSRMLSVKGQSASVRAWASIDSNSSVIKISLLNKSREEASVFVKIEGESVGEKCLIEEFSAIDEEGFTTRFYEKENKSIKDASITLSLPATSITVLTIKQ